MIINRTKNAIRGTIFGGIQNFISLVFPFFIRTIFLKILGAEYLGLGSLFTSILQVMSLAELGVGSALIFSMYKPIAVDDKEKICALMKLYRHYYRLIGLIVLSLGITLIPFLPHFISGDLPTGVNIYVIYIMQLFSAVLSYWLFAYRNSLFQAHQRIDIIYLIGICVNLLTYMLQIISLVIFRSYYVYLAINIASQIIINLVTAFLSKKIYPQYLPKGELPVSEIKEIHRRVGDLFTAKISGVVSNSFDTIVISAFLGLTTLAIYQNYFYIVSAISGILMIFFSSVRAGIGNYLITNTKEKSAELLNNINYIVLFVLNICCACLFVLYQPFMNFWLGEGFLLDFPMVILFTEYLYAYILIRPVVVFKDAAGMWKEDKFRPIVSSLVNLTLNLLTVKKIGLYGILGSTIISYLFVSFPWLIFNVNKYLFSVNIKKFMKKEVMYFFATAFSCAVCYWTCSKIVITNEILTFLAYLLISGILSSIVFLAMFGKTSENIYFIKKLNKYLKSNKL